MNGRRCASVSRLPAPFLASLLLLSLAGCASGTPAFVPNGGEYTHDEALAMARDEDASEHAGRPVSEAPRLRQEFLSDLRLQDEPGPTFAELYTAVFPAPARAVPVRVEAATVDGRSAWLIIEVWGPEGGRLENRRLWILDRESGQVISSSVFP